MSQFKYPTPFTPKSRGKKVPLKQCLFKNNRLKKKKSNKKTGNENKQKPGKRPSFPSNACF